ncbi:MAG: PqqD family peptide modification chaperone [Bacteroidales bacterium]|nr:PqqD family peptide modification chaperone [Bacteroidales bacterium]
MHLKEGYVLRELGEDAIVIGEGVTVDFQRMISLNASAAYLWRSVEGREFTTGTLTDLLLEEYEVGREEATSAAADIAAAWIRAGIAEE